MTEKGFMNSTFGRTSFNWSEGHFNQTNLFQFEMIPQHFPFRLHKFFDLVTSHGAISEQNTKLRLCLADESKIQLEYDFYDGKVKYQSILNYYEDLGIWKRSDRLINSGDSAVNIRRALANYVFIPGDYEVFYQTSRWCCENDGQWLSLQPITLASEGARTTQGATPFVALRNKLDGKGLAFHIIPKGNWEISIQTPSAGVGNPFEPVVQLELGQRTTTLDFPLKTGEIWELPEVLIQAIPNGELHETSPNLHRYFLLNDHNRHDKISPVVYNPWFDNYAMLDNTDRLRRHLQAARELGCEVFEIDAGWYGGEEGDWWWQSGDWRERTSGAFKGKMKDFVAEVQEAGLQFGLWMEPERIGENVPIRKEKPDWFTWGSGGFYYPKLHLEEVYQYIFSEISRLIETYELRWMKFDFNFELGEDELGTNFYRYYEAWYMLLEELRQKYPGTFLEGCASGGGRTDINTVQAFDGHFLSDNVNPWDALRMYQQGILRLPPYRLIKWLVIQPGAKVSHYGATKYEQHSTIVTPAPPGAGFDQYEKVDLTFACLVAANGMFGLSGNYVDLDAEQREEVKKHIDFYKKWRDFFKDAVVYQNEEPKPIGDRKGWVALQFVGEQNHQCLLYVYKLKDLRKTYHCSLKRLDEKAEYRVSSFDGHFDELLSGEKLIREGLSVTLKGNHSAGLWMIEKK
jgi:alpha-galactosidase